MNKGEAFLKRGEHPPSFVSLLHLLLPFTLSSHFTYYILVWILKHVLLQVRRYKRQNSLKKYYSVFVGGIIYMQFLLSCENTNASYVFKCNTAIARHKRGKHFLLLQQSLNFTHDDMMKNVPFISKVKWSVAYFTLKCCTFFCFVSWFMFAIFFILYFIVSWAIHLIFGYRRKQLYLC